MSKVAKKKKKENNNKQTVSMFRILHSRQNPNYCSCILPSPFSVAYWECFHGWQGIFYNSFKNIYICIYVLKKITWKNVLLKDENVVNKIWEPHWQKTQISSTLTLVLETKTGRKNWQTWKMDNVQYKRRNEHKRAVRQLHCRCKC